MDFALFYRAVRRALAAIAPEVQTNAAQVLRGYANGMFIEEVVANLIAGREVGPGSVYRAWVAQRRCIKFAPVLAGAEPHRREDDFAGH